MEHPVVVGVDGSESGFEAVDWAADEAARHGRGLRVVFAASQERYDVVTREKTVGPAESDETARSVLADAERRVAGRHPDLKVSLDLLPQEPVPGLILASREAFVLVIGSRGRGPLKRMLLGSVSLAVAGRVSCPVVVVRGDAAQREGRFGRLLLGVDGTEQGAGAVRFAFREAENRACELRAVHAWHRAPGGQDIAEQLISDTLGPVAAAHPTVRVNQETFQATPRSVLLREAETADLLVLGAHRRATAVGLHLGLVNHALLHLAPCPVAVIPQN